MGPRLRGKGRARFGCRIFLRSQESFARIFERARLCEKLGFDSIFIDDHLLYGTGAASGPDPFTTLAALGTKSNRLRVGVAVTDLIRRHPAILAQTASTLSEMFPNRFFLGLGTGDPMNQTPFGLSSRHSFSVLKEGLKVMRMLWASSLQDPVSFRGRFFSLKNAYLQVGRAAQPPPVYLGALGKKMLKLAGESADGWTPSCHNPETYRKDLDAIQDAARVVGRKLDGFSPSYYTLSSVSKSRDVADKNVLGPAKYFLALIPEGLRKVDPKAKHPGRIWEKMVHPKTQRETIHRIAAAIPDETALGTVIHGTPEDCIEQIDQYMKSGCEELMLTFTSEGGLWSAKGLFPMLRLFSTRVINYFQDN